MKTVTIHSAIVQKSNSEDFFQFPVYGISEKELYLKIRETVESVFEVELSDFSSSNALSFIEEDDELTRNKKIIKMYKEHLIENENEFYLDVLSREEIELEIDDDSNIISINGEISDEDPF